MATASSSTAVAVEPCIPDSEPYGDPGQEVPMTGGNIIDALATVLTHLASLAPGRPNRVTPFHSVRAPQLSILEYLTRIARYFQCSHECFVLALVYIDRIMKLHPDFSICNLNVHRLLVTSVMLAVKFFDDVYYSNAYYAKVGGIRTKEVNSLETQFLKLIEWRLHVSPEEYDQYRKQVLFDTNITERLANNAPADEAQAEASASQSSHYAGGSPQAAPYVSRDAVMVTEEDTEMH